jgi:hypothetical protein
MYLKDSGHFVAGIIVPRPGTNEISCERSGVLMSVLNLG